MPLAHTSDPDVAALLAAAAGDEPLRGTFFVNDAREMLVATREIEQAAREYAGTLYVGFQDAARLDDEAATYRSLVKETSVVAYGVGRPRTQIDGLEWVPVPRDRHALHNQWFLVLTGEESVAFVGYETSPPSAYRKGPSQNAERTWDGFTTGDRRLVDHLIDRLHRVRDLEQRRPGRWYLAATDDGTDPRYAAVRRAALDAASADGAGLILYDRTTESYLTNPYPSGPWSDEGDALSPGWQLSPQALDAVGRGYLAEQLRAAADAGVNATAHLAVDTGATAMADVVARFAPDIVFLPQHLERPSLLDRVKRNTLPALAAVIRGPIRVVAADGTVSEPTAAQR